MLFKLGQWNQRLHSFILLVIGLLILVCLIVFVAVAFTTQPSSTPPENMVLNTTIELATVTPLPTSTPLADDSLPLAPNLIPTENTMPEATLPPIQDRAFDLGIHVQPPNPMLPNLQEVTHGYLDAAANQLALDWVRVEMRWDAIETERDLYNWTAWDIFFGEAVAYQVKVLVVLWGTPMWARAANADPAVQGPPIEAAAFAEFVNTLLRRYPNQIHALEIWQDMNFLNKWDTGLDGAAYTAMLRPVTEVVRSTDPNLILISGGLTPVADGDGSSSMSNLSYMDAMITAGLLDLVDCVGVHHPGYNVAPDATWDNIVIDANATFTLPFENPHPAWSFRTTMTSYANKIAVAGYKTPLCVTQFGWASAEDLSVVPPDFEFARDNSLQEQSTWLVEAIQLMQDWDFIWLAFIWNLNAGPEFAFDSSRPAVLYSLVRPNYVLSPAWQPIAELDFRP